MYPEELEVALYVILSLVVVPVELGFRGEAEEEDLVEFDEDGDNETPEGGGRVFE